MPEVEERQEAQQEPVEGAAPAEEQGEIASESATDETAPKPEGEKQDGALQKRIDKLNRKATLAEERAEYWRQQTLLQQQQPKVETPKPSVPTGKPKAADFEDAEEFVEALTDWKLEQRRKADREARQQQEQETNQQQLQSKVAENLTRARAELPDFDDVMEDAVLPSHNPTAIRLIQESDDGAKLLYNLVKDPEELKRVWALSDPAKIARELGKIEARLTSAPAATTPAPTTSTPPPLKPVAASRQAVARTQTDDDTEWLRQRRAELKQR